MGIQEADKQKYHAWCDKSSNGGKKQIDLICSDKYGNRGYNWANVPKEGLLRCTNGKCGSQDGTSCPNEHVPVDYWNRISTGGAPGADSGTSVQPNSVGN